MTIANRHAEPQAAAINAIDQAIIFLQTSDPIGSVDVATDCGRTTSSSIENRSVVVLVITLRRWPLVGSSGDGRSSVGTAGSCIDAGWLAWKGSRRIGRQVL